MAISTCRSGVCSLFQADVTAFCHTQSQQVFYGRVSGRVRVKEVTAGCDKLDGRDETRLGRAGAAL